MKAKLSKNGFFKKIGVWLTVLALVVGLMPGAVFAVDSKPQTVVLMDSNWDNSSKRYICTITEDTIFDLTAVTPQSAATQSFVIERNAPNLTVTIKGNPDNQLNMNIAYRNCSNYGGDDSAGNSTTLIIDNLNTTGQLKTDLPRGQQHSIQYKGTVNLDQILVSQQRIDTNNYDTDVCLSKAAGAGETDTLNVDDDIRSEYVNLTVDNANIIADNVSSFREYSYIDRDYRRDLTIKNSKIKLDYVDDRFDGGIAGKNITITDSEITNVRHIYTLSSLKDNNSGSVKDLDYTQSEISITGSDIIYNYKAPKTYTYATFTRLGGAKTITIDSSKIVGLTDADDNQSVNVIGGLFETLNIRNGSYVEVCSGNSQNPAIGPTSSLYQRQDIEPMTINIDDSTVIASSRSSAAIGLPHEYLADSKADAEAVDYKLNINISGNSVVHASSANSAAIGGARWSRLNGSDSGMDLGIGSGIDDWGASTDVNGTVTKSSASLSAFSSPSPSSNTSTGATVESVTSDIATKWRLYGDGKVTLTITDKPTVYARSGVLAVYVNDVICNDTNLVQVTRVSPTSQANVFELSKATSSLNGNITLDSTTIGQLDEGYASVAATNLGINTAAEMKFADITQMNVLDNDSTEFTTAATGWQPFFAKSVTFTVSFDANGGSGNMADVTGVSGTYTLPECTFTPPENKFFMGWALTSDGEAIDTATITVDKPTTLYALWGGVTVTPADNVTVSKGANKQFSAVVDGVNNPAITWSVEGNSSADTTIDQSGLLTVAPDETATSLTVKATYNGIEGTAAVSVTVSKKTLEAPKPTLSVDGTKVTVSWDEVEYADSYDVAIYYRLVGDSLWFDASSIIGIDTNTKDLTKEFTVPSNGYGEYQIGVKAKAAAGDSAYTDSAEGRTDTKKFFEVAFHPRNTSDGSSSIPNQIVAEGGKVTKPEDPKSSSDSVKFAYWYVETDDYQEGKKWDFDNDVVTDYLNLYAKWENVGEPGSGTTTSAVNPPVVSSDTSNSSVTSISSVPSDSSVTSISSVPSDSSVTSISSVPSDSSVTSISNETSVSSATLISSVSSISSAPIGSIIPPRTTAGTTKPDSTDTTKPPVDDTDETTSDEETIPDDEEDLIDGDEDLTDNEDGEAMPDDDEEATPDDDEATFEDEASEPDKSADSDLSAADDEKNPPTGVETAAGLAIIFGGLAVAAVITKKKK